MFAFSDMSAVVILGFNSEFQTVPLSDKNDCTTSAILKKKLIVKVFILSTQDQHFA